MSNTSDPGIRPPCLPLLAALLTLVTGVSLTDPALAWQSSELTRFRKSGLPQTIADLKPEAVPDQDNAAWWLVKASDGRLEIDRQVAFLYEFDEPCSEAFLRAYREAIARHPDVLEQLHRAAETTHLVPDRNFDVKTFDEFNAHVDPTGWRSVGRVLTFEAVFEETEGRMDRAVRAALSILELGRKPNYDHGWGGYHGRSVMTSIGLAALNRVLQSEREIDIETLQKIDRELERHDSLDDFQASFDEERALGLQMLRDQGLAAFALQAEGYLKTMRIARENAGKTIAECPELVPGHREAGVAAVTVYPAMQRIRRQAHRNLVQVRGLRILAKIRTMMASDPALEDIDLPGEAKTDPYRDGPLVIEKRENGWRIYSVGPDRIDDGGRLERDQDQGIAPLPR